MLQHLRFGRLSYHLPAVSVLLLSAVIYTWPLLAHLIRAIPGQPNDRDVATFVWNVGWIQHVIDDGADLFKTADVLLPFGADLRLHTYGLLQGLLAYPFTHVLGVVGAYNLILILSLFLNGIMSYSFMIVEVRQRLPALVAAVWVMLAPPLLSHFRVGRPSIASVWIVIGAMLALRSLLQRPRLSNMLALSGFMLAGLLSDLQILLYSAIWLALYGLYRLRCERVALFERRRFTSLGFAALIVTIPVFLIFFPILHDASYMVPTLESMTLYSFRFWDYFTPALIPVIYGYEIFIVTVIALIIWRWHPAYRFWLFASLLFFVLGLGPYLQPTRVPLPFALTDLWSPLRQFRTPSRLIGPAQIGLGVTAAFVLAALFSRLRSRSIVAALAIIAISSRVFFAVTLDPFRIQEYPQYTVYNDIADEHGTCALLEIPFGVRSGLNRIGAGGEVLQYYQHIHHRPILNGMVARLPYSVFAFYNKHPALLFLSGQIAKVDDETLHADLNEVLRWSGSCYALLHHGLLDIDQSTRIDRFLDAHAQLERIRVEGDLVVYRVR